MIAERDLPQAITTVLAVETYRWLKAQDISLARWVPIGVRAESQHGANGRNEDESVTDPGDDSMRWCRMEHEVR